MKLILASGSEWRKRIMEWMKVPFEVVESGVNEEVYVSEDPEEMVAMLAAAKAEKVASSDEVKEVMHRDEESCLVVGADTVIVVGGRVVGKPKDKEDARRTIQQIQGGEHEVLTGLCVINAETGDRRVEVERTVVVMERMTEGEIEKYLKSGEWKGKAGSYQILGSITPYVSEIRDSVTNVVGLPLGLLKEILNQFGVDVEVSVAQVVELETGIHEE